MRDGRWTAGVEEVPVGDDGVVGVTDEEDPSAGKCSDVLFSPG